MRRTYRSKKDTGGVLDPRDVYINMDEKSSAFDAFYIQNIKQTKRGVSCVGSSNQHGVSSSKVRKRKYVKRIIKEVEPARRETISRSAYLTPDKSIRVNKALEPFDLLLNSSPTSQVNDSSFRQFLPDSKTSERLCDELLPKKEKKVYARKKPPKSRNYNCNSQSTDSDKENTDSEPPNTTDIRTHELVIEREPVDSPKYLDESINKIVQNISLLNNLKHSTTNNSFKKNFRCYRNRLTTNIQSPTLQSSPLCSTPFKMKYRGESIYKISPISMKPHDFSQNYVTEEKNDDNASLEPVQNNVAPTTTQNPLSTSSHIKICETSRSLVYDREINSERSVSNIHKDNILYVKDNIDAHHEMKPSSSFDISDHQITEAEPFLGFSNVDLENAIVTKNDQGKSCDEENAMICQNESCVKGNVKNNIENSFNTNTEISKNKILLDSEMSNRNKSGKSEILLDSDDSETSDKNLPCENVTTMNLHDSGNNIANISSEINTSFVSKHFEKANKDKNRISYDSDDSRNASETNISLDCHINKRNANISLYSNDSEKSNKSNKSLNGHQFEIGNECNTSTNNILIDSEDWEKSSHKSDTSDYTNTSLDSYSSEKWNKNDASEKNTSMNSQSSEKESMYDTCDSEQSSLEDNNLFDKQPKVMIDRMNDSLFMKYYVQMANFRSQDEHDSPVNESYTTEDGNYVSFAESKSSLVESDDSSNKKADSTEIKLDKIESSDSSDREDVISSNDDDLNSSSNVEEERCISFVTTRRRNKIPNDSLYIFDNSYETVSSVDCDKTVLSNAKLSLTPNAKIDMSDSIQHNVGPNKISLGDIDLVRKVGNKEDNSTISTITTRKSSRLCRYSNVTVHVDTDSPSKSGFQESKPDFDEDHHATLTNKNEIPTDAELNEDNHLDDTNYSEYSDARSSITTRKRSTLKLPSSPSIFSKTDLEVKPGIVLQPGKKWERSLSIYRRMTTMADHFDRSILDDESLQNKGRKYRQSVISTMEMQEYRGSLHNESINSRRSTFVSKPCRSTIKFVKDPDISRVSLSSTTVYDDLKGFLNEECDDTLIELSKLSIGDAEHEVTVLDNFHDTSERLANARDYVLRRCNQADAILFDECYPDTVLKNCHKIGEGVYGEVFLWRGRDGRARVMKIVPIAGTVKVNGECQKDYDEIISEIVIAMELSALRAPIADINAHFEEGKDIDTLDLHDISNATDVFNEVLAVRYVYGSYPSRLLDLWDLYDECKGSENDNPGVLPPDQRYIVLELANAGQDLESYQFNNAEQAYALFLQVAFALAVGEEEFQFEHRDLHWGNVLIAPTEQEFATFVLRGRAHRVRRRGVAATVIDYSLSRLSPRPHPPPLYNDLAADDALFDALGDYQFEVYRLMRDKLGNDWKNFEPYTNILWLHYTVDKMITALRYKRTNTKLHKQYIGKLKGIKDRILNYRSAVEFVLTDNE